MMMSDITKKGTRGSGKPDGGKIDPSRLCIDLTWTRFVKRSTPKSDAFPNGGVAFRRLTYTELTTADKFLSQVLKHTRRVVGPKSPLVDAWHNFVWEDLHKALESRAKIDIIRLLEHEGEPIFEYNIKEWRCVFTEDNGTKWHIPYGQGLVKIGVDHQVKDKYELEREKQGLKFLEDHGAGDDKPMEDAPQDPETEAIVKLAFNADNRKMKPHQAPPRGTPVPADKVESKTKPKQSSKQPPKPASKAPKQAASKTKDKTSAWPKGGHPPKPKAAPKPATKTGGKESAKAEAKAPVKTAGKVVRKEWPKAKPAGDAKKSFKTPAEEGLARKLPPKGGIQDTMSKVLSPKVNGPYVESKTKTAIEYKRKGGSAAAPVTKVSDNTPPYSSIDAKPKKPASKDKVWPKQVVKECEEFGIDPDYPPEEKPKGMKKLTWKKLVGVR